LIKKQCRDEEIVTREQLIEVLREIEAFREMEGMVEDGRRSTSPLQPGQR